MKLHEIIPEQPDNRLDEKTRLAALGLLSILPLRSKEFTLWPVMLNLLSLRAGQEPVGPDYDISPEWLKEAFLNVLFERQPIGSNQQA